MLYIYIAFIYIYLRNFVKMERLRTIEINKTPYL